MQTITVHNPVLPGFHPDPSICRVGDAFYIATSSFEYFPGVPIYSSRNLSDWRFVGHAITRESQLDMAGNPPSGGIWAPDLSYSNGLFYLIYTNVREWQGCNNDAAGGFKDAHNYLITSERIEGPWSEPVYLNSSGFDPSLFHDDAPAAEMSESAVPGTVIQADEGGVGASTKSGKKWFVNMLWDYRVGKNSFAGIVLQEYDPKLQKLVGPIRNIFTGSERGVTEAPHLYKRGGWYYLMTAEGGTSYFHAVTLARSRRIEGPYELHPDTHVLSSVADPAGLQAAFQEGRMDSVHKYLHPGLQKAGHGSMVPWTEDEWVLAHLCGRPDTQGRCPLGRETALQKLLWKEDAWPYLVSKGAAYEVEFTAQEETMQEDAQEGSDSISQRSASFAPQTAADNSTGALFYWREDFNVGSGTQVQHAWDPALCTLRLPADERFSLRERSGWLRLFGAESVQSRFRQTVLARRVQHLNWRAETCLDFAPTSFQHMAGLLLRYDETTQVFLRVTNTDGERTLGIIHLGLNNLSMPVEELRLKPGPVYLAVKVVGRVLQLSYAQESNAGDTSILLQNEASPRIHQHQTKNKRINGTWFKIGPLFDASIFSDDYVKPMGFTGSFVGLACSDLSGQNAHADFDYLSYEAL